MTKPLKEFLNCDVTIVELDDVEYAEARKYAIDGYCGDIEKLEWANIFNQQVFDYIIFADVLEHLRNPQEVLQAAKQLLADDGHLLISVPNMAHGDIIMNLLDNNFFYTPLGLLDDTHIHFFTYKSMRKMLSDCGYAPVFDDICVRALFATEQAAFISNGGKVELEQIVKGHFMKDAYQLLFDAQKSEFVDAQGIENDSTIDAAEKKWRESRNQEHNWGRLYFDTGNGFRSTETREYYLGATDLISKNLVALPQGTRRVRIDPVEGVPCFISAIQVVSSQGLHKVQPLNGYEFSDGSILFYSTDPQILVDGLDDVDALDIHCQLVPLLSFGHVRLFDSVKQMHENMNDLNHRTRQSEAKLQKSGDRVRQLEMELQDSSSQIESLNIKNTDYLDRLKKQQDIINQLSQERAAAAKDIEIILSSHSWRLTQPLRSIGSLLKR
jgi:predicted SAM-dependent methyltransferase